MKPKFRDILDRCIEEGIAAGMNRAEKHSDELLLSTTKERIVRDIEHAIWLEIDEYFVFEGFAKL